MGSSGLESGGPGAAHTVGGPTGVWPAGGLLTVAPVSPGLLLVPTLSQRGGTLSLPWWEGTLWTP